MIKKILILLVCIVLMISSTGCFKKKKEIEKKESKNITSLSSEYSKAIALKESGKLDEAEKKLEELIKKDGKNGKYYIGLGNVNLKKDKLDDALKNFEKAIELSPNLKEGYNNAAGVRMLKKQYKEALVVIEKGLKAVPEESELLFKKAQLLFVQEKHKEAIAVLEKLADQPQYFEAYRFMGISHLKLANKEKALENLQKYIEKAPDGIQPKADMQKIVDELKKQ